MIELQHVNKRFGKRPAVIDLSMTVPPGSVYGMLGHNGAGKSTTLGMLLGQVFPDSGRLSINGHDVFAERKAAMAHVGAIFESPVFYDYLSGWTNLKIFAAYSGPVCKSRLMDAVELVGLGKRINDRAGTYSHGMRQRLALAQALVPQPKLLILDEPADGLDPEGIREMRKLIVTLNRDWKLTILFSSHMLGEVEQVADQLAIVREGRLLYEGPWHREVRDSGWVRLGVDRFDDAVKELGVAGMITEHDAHRVKLAEGRTPADVAALLVGRGYRVSELSPVALSLEDFYLRVAHDSAGAGSSGEAA